MTLQQIRYFISVAESGSISEAAKRLFTAQSSISSAIKEIENTYDITAFIRESTGVRLTRSGEELLIEFKGILSRLDYLDEKYNGSKKRPLGLSVSAQHHICGMASFISVINKLNERYGSYHCGFYECRTSEVLDRVERGLDDLGIIFFTEHSKGQMIQELRNRGIIFNHIVYQTAHAYLCQNHPLANNTEINIEENGLVTVAAADGEKIEKALEWIRGLTEEPEVGKIYKGKVVTIKEFGAFVNILPGIDGMLHISQISEKRIAKVEDVLKVGQEVKVRLDSIDDKGRLGLSMRGVEQ